MLEEGKISTRQFTLMLFSLLLGSILFRMPRILIEQTKQDVWLVMLVTLATDAALALVFYFLGLRYPNQTMIQYSETILGSWLGKVTGLFFVLFFLGMSTMAVQSIGELISSTVLPDTPSLVLSIVVLLVSFYAVNAGLEVIARLSELIAPLMLISLLFVLLLSLNRVELAGLRPVFQHSIWEILKASLLPTAWYGMCIIMGIFMAYHNIPKESLKAKWIAISSVTVLTIMTLMALMTTLGTNISSQQLYPLYRLAQIIHVGDIFERLDTVVIIFWISGTFVGLTILYYSSTLGLAQILKIKRYQTLTPYIGISILTLSKYSFKNIAERDLFTRTLFPYLALFVEVFLMLMLLIVSLARHGIKKRKVRKKE